MFWGYQSGQLGRTVNPLSYDFAGSNPAPPTSLFNAIVEKALNCKLMRRLCSEFKQTSMIKRV